MQLQNRAFVRPFNPMVFQYIVVGAAKLFRLEHLLWIPLISDNSSSVDQPSPRNEGELFASQKLLW